MKTLLEVKIEPCVGMVCLALKGRYKHHVIEILGDKDRPYRPWSCSNKGIWVHTICETGSGAWIDYDRFVSNYSFVCMSNYRLDDLFNPVDFKIDRLAKVKELMKQIEEAVK